MPPRLDATARIFQIGFNRCGTRTLSTYFELNGMRSVHWDEGRIAQGIERARGEGRPLLCYVDDFDCYTDMEFAGAPGAPPIHAYRYFRELDRDYPGSKFILNTRDVDHWIRSRRRHGGPYKNPAPADVERWRADWHAHHAEVQSYFRGRPRDLLVFNIETDPPSRLSAFLGLEFRPETWIHKGEAGSGGGRRRSGGR